MKAVYWIKSYPDRFAAIVVCFYLSWLTLSYPPVKDNRAIIHDVTSYYGYLPAAFIYHDLDFGFADTMPAGEPLDALWYNALPNGQRFQKMTLGLAYFYTPTYFLADVYTRYHPEFHRNGFSKPYQWAMTLNTLLFGLLSVWLLCMILSKYFTRNITAIVLILLFTATNLPYYISMAPGLSHVYSFFLLALQWLLTLKFKADKKTKQLFWLMLVSAWLVLIRPTNVFPAILPFFIITPKAWLAYFKSNLKQIFWVFLAMAIVWLPQLFYWKHVSGNWVFYSYDQERFFFDDPKILEGLFSFRKGWLIYTPIMVFALAGIGFLKKEGLRPYRMFLIATMPLYLFVVFSWWCWWYGGSYGSRVMIEYYPVLAIFLGVLAERILLLQKFKWAFALLALFFIMLTKRQMHQYHAGLMHWDSMTFDAYKAIFFNDKLPANYQELLKAPDYEAAKKGIR